MQIKLTVRYHSTPIRLRKQTKKELIIPKFGEGNGGNNRSFFSEGGYSDCTTTLEINLTIPSEVENVHPLQPRSPTTRIVHQRNSYTCTRGNILWIFTAALVIAKKWKQPNQ